jgi:lysophospholipase L1-like esterase
VTVTNLASNDSATTITTLSLLTDDPDTRAAVAQADIVTVTIGATDWQGPCTDSGAEACLEQGRATVGDSLGQILDEVTTLRAGQPTAVRVTTYYNSVIGNPSTAEQWAFTPSAAKNASFQAMYAKALDALNTTICRVAVEHSATCVDLLHPFNGPQGNKDAGPLLLEDHVHPSGKGHVLIARTLDAVGYPPLA